MYQHQSARPETRRSPSTPTCRSTCRTEPIIPYIEGTGTRLGVTPVMIKVVDAAVAKVYGGKRKIHWMGSTPEKSTQVYGPDVWLPEGQLRPARIRGLHQGR